MRKMIKQDSWIEMWVLQYKTIYEYDILIICYDNEENHVTRSVDAKRI